jgi:D-3-phosphoglycerate dehydrogenase
MRNISSTAELAWLLILATWRRINLYLIEEFPKSLNASRWIYETSQIKGKTLGIIGFGRIGSMVAVYARSFGMNVVVFDPKYSHKLGGTQDFSVVSEIKDLLKVSDVCLLSASQQKSKSQTPILGCEELRHVKSGAILVNISRGRLWSESCVKEALISGRIAGVGVDVYSDEEISGGAKGMQSPLFTIDAKKFNIVRTPHIGGATMDAIMYTSRLMAHAISRELNSTK